VILFHFKRDALTEGEAPPELSDDDKPNIIVGDDREVHLRVSDAGATDEDSILAAPAPSLPIDSSRDPKISQVPDQKPEGNVKSECCLLL
jgi:hypothetical protein